MTRLPWLVLLFVGSGCAALIYEVVWFQLLQLVLGSSAISLGVLLGTFMAGMCIGSLLLPRLVGPSRHPLRVYAWLELAIAAFGVLLLAVMPAVSGLYASLGGHIAVRIAIALICLLPPTMAMGATLPAVARWVEATPRGMSWLGFFYCGNLAGAVAGTLLAGFYLLRLFDVTVATIVAAALNVIVASAAFGIAHRTRAADPARQQHISVVRSGPGSPLIYVSIALSGTTALAAQVLWTRVLSLSFGATVYTFSLILAAFLTGLGVGSSVGAAVGRRARLNPRITLAWCQVLISCAIAWAAYFLTQVIPFWPISDTIASHPWRTFQLDLVRTLIVVFPGAALWGASFPLALASVASPDGDTGRTVGGIYAANTVGAIVGSLATSLFFAGSLGSQITQQILIGVAAVSAVTAFMAATSGEIRTSRWMGIAVAVVLLVLSVPPVPAALVAYGRRSAEWAEITKIADTGTIIYTGEGLNEFVAVSRGAGGEMNYHAAGKVQASTLPQDMRLQLLLAHLSHLVPARPVSVLVIGCGAGITAGALATGPGIERITIAEIEPLVPKVAAAYFGDYNHHVLDDPRLSLRVDDGRHVLATTTETFDVITTDLIDPWVKGVATLFTREFFELAKRHLRPGGVVTQFVQLYQSSPEAVKSEIGTFVEAFPNAVVWGNPHEGQGYDLVLLGQVEPTRIDIDALQRRFDSSAYAPVVRSLQTIGIGSAVDLLATYAGSGRDLRPWLHDAAINRDRNLRLQYLAGLGLNRDENSAIYQEMLRYARFPEELFTGSDDSVQALKNAIERNRPK